MFIKKDSVNAFFEKAQENFNQTRIQFFPQNMKRELHEIFISV